MNQPPPIGLPDHIVEEWLRLQYWHFYLGLIALGIIVGVPAVCWLAYLIRRWFQSERSN